MSGKREVEVEVRPGQLQEWKFQQSYLALQDGEYPQRVLARVTFCGQQWQQAQLLVWFQAAGEAEGESGRTALKLHRPVCE